MEEGQCIYCHDDFWCNSANDYVGVMVEERGLICKSCEREGIENGVLLVCDIKPPTHLIFVARARPWVNAETNACVSSDWNHVVRVVGHEPNRFDVAFIDDNITCHGNLIEQSLFKGGPETIEWEWEETLQKAYAYGIFQLRVFINNKDVQGTPMCWDYIPSYEDYVTCVMSAIGQHEKTAFLCSHNGKGILPDISLRNLFYFPDKVLSWYGSIQEIENAWKSVDVMLPHQYILKEKLDKKRKI